MNIRPPQIELQGIVSYGYDEEVLPYTDVVFPEDAALGPRIGLEASWLVCEVSCIQVK